MQLKKWMKLIQDYPTATKTQKINFRLNRALRNLEHSCERDKVVFKRSLTSAKGEDIYLWSKGPLAWHVGVSKGGYTATLTFHDKRLNPTKMHLLTHEMDYIEPIDRSRSSMPTSTYPLIKYLKDYFSFVIDLEETAENRKIREAFNKAKQRMTFGGHPSYRITAHSNFNTSLNIRTNNYPSNVVSIKLVTRDAVDAIANLDRECRSCEERLTALLKEDTGILSYEQEHRLETLSRDRISLVTQYRSNTLLNQEAVLPLVEEGLGQLISKLEALEQAVAERQKKDIERTLQVIKER